MPRGSPTRRAPPTRPRVSTPSATTWSPSRRARSTSECTIAASRSSPSTPHDERAVDLERVDFELVEVPERRLAGAEVVERRPHADRAQADEHVDRPLDVGHHDVLGDLELEVLGREAARRAAARPRTGRPRSSRSAGPRFTATLRSKPAAAQLADLLDRAVEHERGQRAGQAALLHQRQEVVGPEQAALRVLPAHQRLDAAHRAGRAGPPSAGSAATSSPASSAPCELADQREPLAAVAIARGQVDLVPGPHALGLVHRDVGALQQAERVAGVLGEQRDADAGVDVQRDVADLERALERRAQAQPGGARRRLVAGASTTANSSPPRRASVSSARSSCASRGPICRSTSSPA